MQISSASCVLLFLAFSVTIGQRSVIKLVNNGYEDILIAIRSDVTENYTIIENIKEYFTKASAVLYKATNNRTYFRDIIIFIPETWSNYNDTDPVTSEAFSKANVVISPAGNGSADGPYTKQKVGCGEEGEFIFLPTWYILDTARATRIYGPVAKTLVHEWGHLRWGLLNEHPGTDYDHCIFDGTNIIPVKCSVGMDVSIYQHPVYKCRVIPKYHSQSATASMMYAPELDDVYKFCDNSDDPGSQHNADVLNEHNQHCDGQSAWEIMDKHKDFINNANTAREIADTAPTFRLVQCKDVKIILILDVSGSMSGSNIRKQKQSAEEYIMDIIPDNAYVMIIAFSSTASVLHSFVKITSNSTRTKLAQKVPSTAYGSTCIGCGIKLALDNLENKLNKVTSGAILTVLTDGKENRRPLINYIKPRVLTSQVTINAIMFTTPSLANNHPLITISKDTRGVTRIVQPSESPNNLYVAFKATTSCQTDDVTDQEIEVESTIVVPNSNSFQRTLYVDSNAAMNTKFKFSWSNSQKVTVNLKLPNETLITRESEAGKNELTITMSKALVGKYTYTLQTSNSGAVSVSLSGKTGGGEAVMLQASVSTDDLDLGKVKGVVIYGELRKGNRPVVDAVVTAEIDGRNGSVQLKDDGAGFDFKANDGIYTAFFNDFNSNGKVNIVLSAKTIEGTSKVREIKLVTTGATPLNFYEGKIEEITEGVEPLRRRSSAGVIEIKNVDKTAALKDETSPSKVTDLRAVNISSSDRSFCLLWTAVGDDLVVGRASSYELRSCSASVKLRRNFTLCDQIFNNITTPKISGEMERMCFDIPYPSNNVSFFVALRVKDENNNTSPVSNLQQVSYVDIATLDLPVYTSETPSAPATTEPIETTQDPVEMYSTSETFSTTVKQFVDITTLDLPVYTSETPSTPATTEPIETTQDPVEMPSTSETFSTTVKQFVDITTLDLPVYTSETPSAPATTEPIETTQDPVEMYSTSETFSTTVKQFVDITTLDLPVYTSKTPSAPATTEPIETTQDPVEMPSTSETFSTTVKQITSDEQTTFTANEADITSAEAQSTATPEQIISGDLVGLIVAGSMVVISLIMLLFSLWVYKVHSQRLKRKKDQPLPEVERFPTAVQPPFLIPRCKLDYSRTAYSPEYAYRLRL